MATDVQICNLALSHLGATRTISSLSPPDGSPYADQCTMYYPMARDAVLRAGTWGFAQKRLGLALLASASPGDWTYAYNYPADCVRANRLLPPTGDTPQPFERGLVGSTRVIYADQEEAVLVYTARVDNPALFDDLFATAVSQLLASYLALPVARNDKLRATLYQAYLETLGQAAVTDANEGHRTTERTGVSPSTPDWIAKR